MEQIKGAVGASLEGAKGIVPMTLIMRHGVPFAQGMGRKGAAAEMARDLQAKGVAESDALKASEAWRKGTANANLDEIDAGKRAAELVKSGKVEDKEDGQPSSISPEQEKVKGELFDLVKNRTDEADRKYDGIPETYGGKVLSVDASRYLSNDYATKDGRIKYSQATNEPANEYFIGRIRRALANPPEPREGRDAPTLMMTAGGAGSGKSTILDKKTIDNNDLVIDSQMRNPDLTAEIINYALRKGWNVEFNYVYRPLADSVAGVIERANKPEDEKGGRWHTLSTIVNSHMAAQDTAVKMAKLFGGESRFKINLRETKRGEKAIPVSISDIDKGGDKHYNEGDEHEYHNVAKQAYEAARNSGRYDPRILDLIGEETNRSGLAEKMARGERSSHNGSLDQPSSDSLNGHTGQAYEVASRSDRYDNEERLPERLSQDGYRGEDGNSLKAATEVVSGSVRAAASSQGAVRKGYLQSPESSEKNKSRLTSEVDSSASSHLPPEVNDWYAHVDKSIDAMTDAERGRLTSAVKKAVGRDVDLRFVKEITGNADALGSSLGLLAEVKEGQPLAERQITAYHEAVHIAKRSLPKDARGLLDDLIPDEETQTEALARIWAHQDRPAKVPEQVWRKVKDVLREIVDSVRVMIGSAREIGTIEDVAANIRSGYYRKVSERSGLRNGTQEVLDSLAAPKYRSKDAADDPWSGMGKVFGKDSNYAGELAYKIANKMVDVSAPGGDERFSTLVDKMPSYAAEYSRKAKGDATPDSFAEFVKEKWGVDRKGVGRGELSPENEVNLTSAEEGAEGGKSRKIMAAESEIATRPHDAEPAAEVDAIEKFKKLIASEDSLLALDSAATQIRDNTARRKARKDQNTGKISQEQADKMLGIVEGRRRELLDARKTRADAPKEAEGTGGITVLPHPEEPTVHLDNRSEPALHLGAEEPGVRLERAPDTELTVAQKARAAADHWRSKIGTYTHTALGVEGDEARGVKGGTYKEINERRAESKAKRMERLAEKAEKGELTDDESAEINRAHRSVFGGKAPEKVEAAPGTVKEGETSISDPFERRDKPVDQSKLTRIADGGDVAPPAEPPGRKPEDVPPEIPKPTPDNPTGEPTGSMLGTETWRRWWQRKLQDRANRLNQLVDLVKKKKPIPSDDDPYQSVMNMVGRQSERLNDVRWDVYDTRNKGSLVMRMARDEVTPDGILRQALTAMVERRKRHQGAAIIVAVFQMAA